MMGVWKSYLIKLYNILSPPYCLTSHDLHITNKQITCFFAWKCADMGYQDGWKCT